MTQALSEKAPFTAVVAHNDSVAIGAVETLLQQGFRIPDDVSIVGFGDGVLAANFRVPLTTVRVPQTEMGETALRLALELQKGDTVAAAPAAGRDHRPRQHAEIRDGVKLHRRAFPSD